MTQPFTGIEKCRKYWHEKAHDLPVDPATVCQSSLKPPIQCRWEKFNYCKGKMLVGLIDELPEPTGDLQKPLVITEFEEILLWHAIFNQGGELNGKEIETVNASFLQWLLTNPKITELISSYGIRIKGINVKGDLNLNAATIKFPLIIRDSTFEKRIILTDAKTRYLGFMGIRQQCQSIEAARINVEGSLNLNKSHVVLTERFKSDSDEEEIEEINLINLKGARISGDLDCGGCHLDIHQDLPNDRDKKALTLDRAEIQGKVLLNNNFRANGEVSLKGVKITGDLDCRDGYFKNLDIEKNEIIKKEIYALNTSLSEINGNILFSVSEDNQEFQVEGHILAIGMKVRGDFDCTQRWIKNDKGTRHAISIDRSEINGSLFLRNGFKALGQVRLIETKIGKSLDCSGGIFEKAPKEKKIKVTLEARSAEVGDCVYLCGSLQECQFGSLGAFKTNGWINLDFTKVGHNLVIGQDDVNCKNAAELESDIGTNKINIRNAEIVGALYWYWEKSQVRNNKYRNLLLSLDNTTVGGLTITSMDAAWPESLSLRNFKYSYINFIDPDSSSYATCLRWLERHDGTPECDFRLMAAPNSNHENIISGFKEEFELKKQLKKDECAVLIIIEEGCSENLTIAGFDSDGKFQQYCAKRNTFRWAKHNKVRTELKKRSINKGRIVTLVAPLLKLKNICKQDRFYPQAYNRLADIQNQAGLNTVARRLLYEKQCQLTKHNHSSWDRVWGYIWKITVGYGYYPEYALICFLISLSIGLLLFDYCHVGEFTLKNNIESEFKQNLVNKDENLFISHNDTNDPNKPKLDIRIFDPSGKRIVDKPFACNMEYISILGKQDKIQIVDKPITDHTLYNPALHPGQFVFYIADLLLPVTNLHERDNWVTQDGVAYWASKILTIFGWFFAVVLGAGLAGILKKDVK